MLILEPKGLIGSEKKIYMMNAASLLTIIDAIDHGGNISTHSLTGTGRFLPCGGPTVPVNV